jgi:hypothetical protein
MSRIKIDIVKEPYDLTSGSERDFDEERQSPLRKRGSDFFLLKEMDKKSGSPVRIPPRTKKKVLK